MTYTIEPDGHFGRLYLTELPSGDKVSTVDLEQRDQDGATGTMGAMLDGLLGRNGRYETAVIPVEDSIKVVAVTDNAEEAEAQHRRVVENLIDGTMLDEHLPPTIRALKRGR